MKLCSRCNTVKDESEFYKKTGAVVQAFCKKCFNEYCIERWKQKKIDVVKVMGGKCNDCNTAYHPNVYDIHHLDPSQKSMSWDKLRLQSKATILDEISRCILLCANCHRLRHL